MPGTPELEALRTCIYINGYRMLPWRPPQVAGPGQELPVALGCNLFNAHSHDRPIREYSDV